MWDRECDREGWPKPEATELWPMKDRESGRSSPPGGRKEVLGRVGMQQLWGCCLEVGRRRGSMRWFSATAARWNHPGARTNPGA